MSVIGVVASAAGGLDELTDGLIRPLVAAGHQPAITFTPTAVSWVPATTIAELGRLTGLPVRSQPRLPGEPKPHPPIDVFVAAPASANTVAKLALGIADNQALTVLVEALGSTPMVVLPRVNAAHARHPAWAGHLAVLRKAGVRLELHEPREAAGRPLPWDRVLRVLADELGLDDRRRAAGGGDG
ncbi:flavoprotein [Kribbella sp. NPDC020789]